MDTLLGTPVQLLINANMYSANGMIQWIYTCRHGQDDLLKYITSITMGKKCDLTDFESGMNVDTRQADLSISETADK